MPAVGDPLDQRLGQPLGRRVRQLVHSGVDRPADHLGAQRVGDDRQAGVVRRLDDRPDDARLGHRPARVAGLERDLDDVGARPRRCDARPGGRWPARRRSWRTRSLPQRPARVAARRGDHRARLRRRRAARRCGRRCPVRHSVGRAAGAPRSRTATSPERNTPSSRPERQMDVGVDDPRADPALLAAELGQVPERRARTRAGRGRSPRRARRAPPRRRAVRCRRRPRPCRSAPARGAMSCSPGAGARRVRRASAARSTTARRAPATRTRTLAHAHRPSSQSRRPRHRSTRQRSATSSVCTPSSRCSSSTRLGWDDVVGAELAQLLQRVRPGAGRSAGRRARAASRAGWAGRSGAVRAARRRASRRPAPQLSRGSGLVGCRSGRGPARPPARGRPARPARSGRAARRASR